MIGTTLTPPEQRIELSDISWKTYETLLTELSSRRLRLTYNRGTLEIMVPSPEHERYKKIVGRFVETLAEELEVKIEPLGSTTFKYPEISGAEPAECFYIQNISAVKGKKRIDLNQDPPPDLVIEVDITSSSQNRFQVYADMGVLEIWRYDGNAFSINILQNQEYITSRQSLAFPNVPVGEISRFLEEAETTDYLELIQAFRKWVKSQIQE
ncbi:Uma2 family endonuclease [Microcoleus sp. FACHB-672]|uniref:Uma2 family endonuclease n=1 Tax=Microcoleus sp. FACHB-672 TaxID=2692825 RepID=UPI00168235D0|nr:Uma2 family endonuclease [Microcoleus sp. FACHB-672]MBD2042986.1 Uma2 family endonuclease [Microcoleus sp. FACHB-672]